MMRVRTLAALILLSLLGAPTSAPCGWEQQYGDTPGMHLGQVHFSDQWHGWAVGFLGTVLKTTDGGETWDTVNHGFNLGHAWAVYFLDPWNGWVAGGDCGPPQQGWIIHTTDAGATWDMQFDYGSEDWTRFYGLWFVDYDNGWVAVGGQNGRVYCTSDGGVTWMERVLPDTEYGTVIRGVHFEDQWVGWVAGGLDWGSYGAGIVCRTTDGGSTWELQHQMPSGHFLDVWFASYSHGWVVGGRATGAGVVFCTEDGGETWVQQTVPAAAKYLGSVCFVDDSRGWVVGSEYSGGGVTVLSTTDGGQTWSLDPNTGQWPLEKPLNGVCFTDATNGWVVGRDQRIVRYTAESTLEFDDGQCHAELLEDQDGDGYHRRADLHFAVSELVPGKSADGYVEAWASPAGAGQYVCLGATQVFTASGYYTSSYPVAGDDLYTVCGIDHGLWDFELRLFSSAGMPWDVTNGNGQLDGVPMETGAQDAPNQPPHATFSLEPDSVETNERVSADASLCWDDKDPVDSLWVRWDWNGDGTYETGWSRDKVDSTFYPSLGTRSVVLEVRDTGGLSDTEARTVWVLDLPPDPATSLQAADVPGDQGGAIRLEWMLSGDDGDNADDVTGYDVWRRQDGNATYDTLSTAPAGTGAYVDTTALDGVPYWYVVAASDGQFTTASEEAGPVESLDDIAPLAPGGFDAELHPGAGAVLLTVQRSPDDGGGAGDVQIYRLAWGSSPTPPYTFLCDLDASAQNSYEHWDSLVIASHYAVWALDGANGSDTLVAATQLDAEGQPFSGKLSLELRGNPCRGVASASYSLRTAGEIEVSVYDLSGKLVAEIFRGHANAGAHVAHWRPGGRVHGARPGVYVWHLRSCGRVVARRFVVVE